MNTDNCHLQCYSKYKVLLDIGHHKEEQIESKTQQYCIVWFLLLTHHDLCNLQNFWYYQLLQSYRHHKYHHHWYPITPILERTNDNLFFPMNYNQQLEDHY